jgi:hypothetical protein
MARNGKNARPMVRHLAYRSAFELLDAVLAKNAYSEHEKTQFWLTKMFGRPPGKAVNPKRRQRIHPGKSD